MSYYNLAIKYTMYVKEIKEFLLKNNVIDKYGKVTEEYKKQQKFKDVEDDIFLCLSPMDCERNEDLHSRGIVTKKRREQYKQEQERLAQLKKQVRVNKEIEITHPDIEGVWKIKILSVHFVVKDKEMPHLFGVPDKIKVRVCEANIKDNTIAEDTPLALALLGKFENDEYSYTIGDETISGKIVKVY